MKLPDRWLRYSNCKHIQGTRFVACKTPLRTDYNRSLTAENSFTPSDLLLEYPQIQLVIDLTFTYRYYNGHLEFVKRGIQYVKIKCKGKQVPDSDVYKKFCSTVEKFVENSPKGTYIAVHCTHGVNRTGYLIARYMIDKLGYSPRSAVEAFAAFRGHAIERENYVDDLMGMASSSAAAEAEWITVISGTFKRCRSAINVNDPTLIKIAEEINLAEMLLLEYLNEMSSCSGDLPHNPAVDHMSQLVLKELEYLRKLKNSEVVSINGSFATFKSEDGEFMVTVVPEEELQRNLYPLSCFNNNIKPRFAKPMNSGENLALPSPSAESIYYDASCDLPEGQTSSVAARFGESIFGLLSYIFASTIGRMDSGDAPC